jgi:hypothetical protein
LQRQGGYGAFRADPALTAALARGGEFAQSAQLSPEPTAGRGGPSLLTRYLAACGAEGMALPELDVAEEARLLRVLLQEQELVALREAHIALVSEPTTRREAANAARLLADAATVERARAHFDEYGATDAAETLDAYLNLRRTGGWTPPQEAPTLAALIARAGVELDAARLEAESLAQAPPAPEKPKGLLAAMRGLFGR